MSLKIWLPLNGSTINQGTAGFQPTTASITYNNTGKVTSSSYSSGTITMTAAQSQQILNNKTITIAFWIKPQSQSTNSIIFGDNGDENKGTVRQFSLFQFNGDATKHGTTLHWSWGFTLGAGENYDANGNYLNTNDQSTIADALPVGQWTHVCITYSNPTFKAYINGQLRAVRTGAVNYTFNQATPIINTSGNRHINDFRIYDHCLSPREVKLLAQGLVAHYKLDKPTGKINYVKGASKYTAYSPLIRNANEVPQHMYDSYIYHSTSDMQVIIPEAGNYTWILSSNGKPNEHATVASTEKCFSMWLYNGTKNYVWSNYGTGEDGKHYGLMENIPAGTYTIRTNLYASDNVNYTLKFWNIKLIKGNYVPWDSWSPYSDNLMEYDSSGYGNHGTESGALETTTDSSRYSYSTIFENNKYILTPARSYAGMKDSYTFSYWAKIPQMHGKMIFGFIDGNRLNVFPWNTEANPDANPDKSWFNWNTNDSANTPFRDNGVNVLIKPYNNTWHHYAITGDGSETKLYIDGAYAGTASSYKAIDDSNTQIVFSGYDTSTNYKWNDGQISDFRIYATALSAAAVKELYQSSISFLNNGTLQCSEIVEKDTNIKYNKNGIIQAELISEIGYTNKMKIKILSDGSAWARIHWLDVSANPQAKTSYFANAEEVQECIDKTNRFSLIKYVDKFKSKNNQYEFMLTYPKISTTLYNRWTQNIFSNNVNDGDSIVFNLNPNSAWQDHAGPLKRAQAGETIYDCDNKNTGNWYAPIGQISPWDTNAIPAATGNSTTETELWVRIDNLPKLTKLSMFDGALQAHQIYEL